MSAFESETTAACPFQRAGKLCRVVACICTVGVGPGVVGRPVGENRSATHRLPGRPILQGATAASAPRAPARAMMGYVWGCSCFAKGNNRVGRAGGLAGAARLHWPQGRVDFLQYAPLLGVYLCGAFSDVGLICRCKTIDKPTHQACKMFSLKVVVHF